MQIDFYKKSLNKAGILIILGTSFLREQYKVDNVKSLLQENTALDVTVLDLTDQDYNERDLRNGLEQYFNNYYEEYIIIAAIHGSQVLPGGGHYSIVGPVTNTDSVFRHLLGDSIWYFINSVFSGNIVKSSNVLKIIGESADKYSVKGDSLNIWQFTCQGAKLYDDAVKYLPKGTNYVAESKGFYQSNILLNTITNLLSENTEFSFNDLFYSYLATNYKMNTFAFAVTSEPYKIKLGEPVETSIQKADRLVTEIKEKTTNQEHLIEVLNQTCNLIEQVETRYQNLNKNAWSAYISYKSPYCIDQLETQINSLSKDGGNLYGNKKFVNCINSDDHLSYIEIMLHSFIKKLEKHDFTKGFKTQQESDCLMLNLQTDPHTYYSENSMAKYALIAELYYEEA